MRLIADVGGELYAVGERWLRDAQEVAFKTLETVWLRTIAPAAEQAGRAEPQASVAELGPAANHELL